MRHMIMLLGLVALSGCPAAENNEEEAAPEQVANEEEMAKEAEGAMADAVEAAPSALALGDLMGAKDAHMGKPVTVRAMLGASGEAAEGEMVEITLNASGEEGAASITCVSKGALEGEENAEVTVSGTMVEKDGKVVLENCMKAEAPAAEEAEAGDDEAAEGMDADETEGDGEGH